jgi:hypothetical protein
MSTAETFGPVFGAGVAEHTNGSDASGALIYAVPGWRSEEILQ